MTSSIMPSSLRPSERLQASEQWWSRNYESLLERGYRLRQRYNKRAMDAWLVHHEFDHNEARRRGLLDVPVRLWMTMRCM